MSNVILGIIGVVLFIGLAVASAVILGTDFSNASGDAKAAGLAAGGAQIVMAYNSYIAKEGEYPANYTPEALMPRYLKASPVNPTNSANAWNSIKVDGTLGFPAHVYIAGISTDASAGTNICRSLAEQSRQTLPATGNPRYANMAQLPTPVGCFQPTANFGSLRADRVYAYVKV